MALWAALASAGVFAYREQSQPSLLTGLILPLSTLAVAVPLGRTRPGTAVFLANAVCALGLADPVPTASGYLPALVALAYLLAIGSADTRSALLLFGACLALDLTLCAVLRVDAVYWFYAVSMLPLAMLLPWLAGRFRQARLAVVRGGWERAEILERQRDVVAEQARLRERARIAADMHDSLGHQLSLIALHAGALELSPTLTGRDRADLAALRTIASDAVGHLRDTIGVLREGAADSAATTSSIEPVEELVARVGESGVAVDLRRNGSAPALSPLVEHAVYRVVQESLTNTIKHARGSAVRIRITHRGGRTTVRVTNSAPPAASPSGPTSGPTSDPVAPPGSGSQGLVGLRERVLLIGGTLRAAPRDGGFEVVAGFPDRVRPERAGATDRPSAKAGSESVRELAAARRSARFRFAAAFALPAGTALVMLASAAYLALRLSGCVLAPSDYAALRVGGDRADFANSLPLRQFPFVPDEMRTLPRPAGAVCEFYRSNGNLLEQVDVYRLCFAGSRLVGKDVLPANGDPPDTGTPAPSTPELR